MVFLCMCYYYNSSFFSSFLDCRNEPIGYSKVFCEERCICLLLSVEYYCFMLLFDASTVFLFMFTTFSVVF